MNGSRFPFHTRPLLTVGQPDAGVQSGGGYTLAGGFWGGAVVGYRIYLPLALRNF